MRIRRPSHRSAHTFLVHVFGRGLDGERYVVERFRSRPDGQIDPVEVEQPTAKRGGRKSKRTIVSASEVKMLRPERDEIIICTALNLEGVGGPDLGLGGQRDFRHALRALSGGAGHARLQAPRRGGPTLAFAGVTPFAPRAVCAPDAEGFPPSPA